MRERKKEEKNEIPVPVVKEPHTDSSVLAAGHAADRLEFIS